MLSELELSHGANSMIHSQVLLLGDNSPPKSLTSHKSMVHFQLPGWLYCNKHFGPKWAGRELPPGCFFPQHVFWWEMAVV